MADITQADVDRRFTSHEMANGEAWVASGWVREGFVDFARQLVDRLPASREKSLAFTALEEASFWAQAAIARHQAEVEAIHVTFDPGPWLVEDREAQ